MLSELIDAVRNAETRTELCDFYMAARHVARAEGAMFELAEAWSAADNRLPEVDVEPLTYFG